MSTQSGSYREQVEKARRNILTDALVANGGNRTHAAAALGLSRPHLIGLMKELGIDVPSTFDPRKARESR